MENKQTDNNHEEATRLTVEYQDTNKAGDEAVNYNELPPPPDGGYGWVIVIASFFCNCIVDGIVYSFGIFLDDFCKYFDVGKGTISWAGSLLSGVYMCVGPIVSALANKYGCRAVCIAGSIVAALAFTLSTLSTNVKVFFITYGVMGGAGFGMIYLPAIVFVGYYFEKKRSLATGIAVCGSGFGAFVFAPLSSFLLETLGGWKSANLVLACILLCCIVCGALMRPLQWPEGANIRELQPLNLDPGVQCSNLAIDRIPTNSALPTIVETKVSNSVVNRSMMELKVEEKQRSRLNSESDIERMRRRKSSATGSNKASRTELDKAVPVMLRKDVFYSGSVQNLKEFQSQKSLTAYRNSIISLNKLHTGEVENRQGLKVEEMDEAKGCSGILGSLMDVSLLKDWTFMFLAVSNLFGMAALFVPFFYIVDSAKQLNIENPSSLISIIGITNTFGRIACGYVADFPAVNSLLLNNCCLVLCAIALAAVPLCTTYAMYMIASVVFGIGLAGYMSLTSIILVDLLGLDKLTNAFGLLIMFRGAAAIFGAPLIGGIYDLTNSYSASFFAAGGLFGVAAVFSFLAPVVAKFKKS
ncbi:monocarboxylate transporter 14-like isoform X1 [Chironomus tepperi]|uniref:monocarboxylate transporter 14-like isoform X1 n=1 Tax=Chironomus tepperi TaxID=113505 RepID=UPI00391F3A2C